MPGSRRRRSGQPMRVLQPGFGDPISFALRGLAAAVRGRNTSGACRYPAGFANAQNGSIVGRAPTTGDPYRAPRFADVEPYCSDDGHVLRERSQADHTYPWSQVHDRGAPFGLSRQPVALHGPCGILTRCGCCGLYSNGTGSGAFDRRPASSDCPASCVLQKDSGRVRGCQAESGIRTGRDSRSGKCLATLK